MIKGLCIINLIVLMEVGANGSQHAGANTNNQPSLASLASNLIMAWKGVEGDQRIWYSKFDGNNWSSPTPVAGANTSNQPSLESLASNLIMVWKGVEGDQRIWYSKFDGNNWSSPRNIVTQTAGAGANTSNQSMSTIT
jgi:hypothetical protein